MCVKYMSYTWMYIISHANINPWNLTALYTFHYFVLRVPLCVERNSPKCTCQHRLISYVCNHL
jgi:hypothetical protein